MDFNKGHLLSFYEAIEEQRKDRDNIDKEIQIKLLEYRINSVNRVLNYMVGLDEDMDNLLTHCINKLNGNIDGIELDLKEE